MKTMWTFSVTKGWFRSENSLAETTTPRDLTQAGFKQIETRPKPPQLDPNPDVLQAVFFQRVKKARVDYLARYIVGETEFWFYMSSTPSFMEIFCRLQQCGNHAIMVRSHMTDWDIDED